MIEKDFGTWTAWTRGAHHPKVVVCRNANDPIIRKTRHFFPDIRGFVICMINGNQKPIFWNIKFFCDQFPRKWDRVRFEVIAKGKVTQHFKKCMVTRGIADVVQIIMFATGAHAFLRSGRTFVIACFNSGEQVLKLDHARVGEHQSGVVPRNQWA